MKNGDYVWVDPVYPHQPVMGARLVDIRESYPAVVVEFFDYGNSMPRPHTVSAFRVRPMSPLEALARLT